MKTKPLPKELSATLNRYHPIFRKLRAVVEASGLEQKRKAFMLADLLRLHDTLKCIEVLDSAKQLLRP